MAVLSVSDSIFSTAKAIAKTTAKFNTNLVKVNRHPNDDISKSNRGIRIFVLAHRKINTFEMRLPFFSNIPPTGNSAYRGTAVTTPSSRAVITPLKPDFSPIILTIVSRSTHTSSKPIQIKIGVSRNKKLRKLLTVKFRALFPVCGKKSRAKRFTITTAAGNQYFLNSFFMSMPPLQQRPSRTRTDTRTRSARARSFSPDISFPSARLQIQPL